MTEEAVSLDEICAALSGALPSLFECRRGLHGDVQVITPLIYPDGGLVDVFVVKRGGQYVVTDYVDAHGWLRMQSWTSELAPRQEVLIARACRSLGVDLDHGRLSLCCEDAAELAQTILLVAQAALRVAHVRLANHSDELANSGKPSPANRTGGRAAAEPEVWRAAGGAPSPSNPSFL